MSEGMQQGQLLREQEQRGKGRHVEWGDSIFLVPIVVVTDFVLGIVLSSASGEGNTCSQCLVYTVHQPVFYRDEQGRQTAVAEECLCFVL